MMNKKTAYYGQAILRTLIDSTDIVTTSQLALITGLTEKTVRVKIENINNVLYQENLGEIKKKRGAGLWLDATDSQKITVQRKILGESNNIEYSQNNDARMYQALKIILANKKNKKMTTAKLADDMYLSVPTVLKTINDCKDWLSLFDIKLVILRNKGFELEYTESQYRIALKHFILKLKSDEKIDDRISFFIPGIDLYIIRKLIKQTELEWEVDFAEESFNEIYVFLCIMISRNIEADINKIITIPERDLRMLQSYNEYNFAEALLKKITKLYKFDISVHEIGFMCIPILCSKIIDPLYNLGAGDIIRQYDDKLKHFVEKIISVVSEVLNVDLTNDDLLFNGLLMHLRPGIFRLRYEKSQENTLKGYIRNEYKNAYRVAWLISFLFEEHFGLYVTEDELGFITLYIQSALERNQKKLNVVLVTRTSMGINQMISDKIKRNFTQIENISIVSVHDFLLSNYKKADMIISTQALDSKSEKIVEIDEIISESSIKKLEEAIILQKSRDNKNYGKFDLVCHSLFEPDLIFLNKKFESKEKIIKFMCNELVIRGYATKEYEASVLDHENLVSTSIGNMVSTPHGDQNKINEAKVAILTLNRPIQWGEEFVDVVFLLAVKMTNDFEENRTQCFYRQYINLVDTDADVKVLKQFTSNIELYKYLVK